MIKQIENFCAEHNMRIVVYFELGNQEQPVDVMISEEMIRVARGLAQIKKTSDKMRDSWWKRFFSRGGDTTKEKWVPGRSLPDRATTRFVRRRGPNDTQKL